MPKKKNTVRADGRISVQIYLGRDENGKRKYKTVYGATQKEADYKSELVKLSMRKGLDAMAAHDTFDEWAERWFKIKDTEVSTSQSKVYKSRINFLNLYIGKAQIKKVKPIDLQEIINSLAIKNPNTGKPASKRMIEITKNTLTQIFRLVIENRVIDYNPAISLKIPKDAPAYKRRALTEIEREWVHDTEHRARRAAMIMMYAGLRRGELIPLMWNDIDLSARTIKVNKSVENVGGIFEIKHSTKTESGMRTVDIPQKLVDFLEGEPRENIYVCVSAKNEFLTVSAWRRLWDSYLSELNLKYGDFSHFGKVPKSKYDPNVAPFVIPKITPHWLRHTFATLLYLAGVDVLTAKEQLGHLDVTTTLGIYTHLDKQYKRKAMDKLDDFLSDASQMQVKHA